KHSRGVPRTDAGAGWQSVSGVMPTEIECADYEIRPFRTAGHACFEDGRARVSWSTSGTVNGCSTARSVERDKGLVRRPAAPSAVPTPVQDASARPEDAQSQSLKTRRTPSSFGTFSRHECFATIPHRWP